MFGKVKRWLGIEGVKVTLILPEAVAGAGGVLNGQLKFETMHPQTVEKIRIHMMEKYTRGRWKNKLADLYKIGEIELDEDIEVPADTPIIIDFELPFTISKSAERNPQPQLLHEPNRSKAKHKDRWPQSDTRFAIKCLCGNGLGDYRCEPASFS